MPISFDRNVSFFKFASGNWRGGWAAPVVWGLSAGGWLKLLGAGAGLGWAGLGLGRGRDRGRGRVVGELGWAGWAELGGLSWAGLVTGGAVCGGAIVGRLTCLY